jgi:hypothetical protein
MPRPTHKSETAVAQSPVMTGLLWMRRVDAVDWLVEPGREPDWGAHIVTSRRFYLHHGIYVGGGNVVHYAGFTRGLRRGPVEEVSIERFSSGGAVWVRFDGPLNVDRAEVVRRARSRLGENRYRLLDNNCFHFCNWCLYGEQPTRYVKGWLSNRGRMSATLHGFVATNSARLSRSSRLSG